MHCLSCRRTAVAYLAATLLLVGARPLSSQVPDAPPPPSSAAQPTDEAIRRYADAVEWLAADARQGRGIGTAGLEQAAVWLEERFAEIGLAPTGVGGSYRQPFEVPVGVEVGPGTRVEVDGTVLSPDSYAVASFSAAAEASGELVRVGYGITVEGHGIDDYAGVDVEGRIVVVRRFTPAGGIFDDPTAQRRFSDLRYKAFNAREHGAIGAIVVDLPDIPEGEMPAEAPLPFIRIEVQGDAGIPVVIASRDMGRRLLDGRPHRATLAVNLIAAREPAFNIVGVLPAGAPETLPGAVVIGAHYDHLGMGGSGSLAAGVQEPHNGADDNASGTAALLETARILGARRAELRRDVYFVAFSAEELGTLGSTHFTRYPPDGVRMDDVIGMINMDMVGRLRENRLSVLGGESALEWVAIVEPRCQFVLLECSISGSGYGPSDHSPFYAAGVPVVHLFTGSHDDYHRPSDDADKINSAAGVRVAQLAAEVAVEVSRRPAGLTYQSAVAPAPAGDVRAFGASLGTVPDYAGPEDGRPGVLLSGVQPDSPAEKGGLRRGDLLVGLAGREIRDINDFMYILQSARPGETAIAVVERDGDRLELEVIFGERRRM